MNRKIIIESTERDRIRGLYNLPNMRTMNKQYVFEAAFTTNEKYFILNDQVFDVFEKRELGYLWESLDIFKEIFKNTNIDDSDYQSIQESILDFPLLEGKKNLYELRDILLEFDFMQDTWVGREFGKAGTAISDTVTSSWDGLKKFGISISKGEWSEILTLLGKGVLYIVRKLKDALYSNIGMVVDAILVGSGVGKAVQWIPWALVVALDVYQLISNDWPPDEISDSLLSKWMTLGFSILGLVSTGALAKYSKSTFAPFSRLKPTELGKVIKTNPKLLKVLQDIKSSLPKATSKLKQAQGFLSKKFPAGADFIGSILGKIGGILSSINKYLDKIFGVSKIGKGLKAGTVNAGILYGLSSKSPKAPNPLENLKIQSGSIYDPDLI